MISHKELIDFGSVELNNWVKLIVNQGNINLKFVAPRKRKLGDYRHVQGSNIHQITINIDLPPVLRLITIIHEVAHKTTFDRWGMYVKPHGMEWKKEFKTLLAMGLTQNPPFDFKIALEEIIIKPRASHVQKPSVQKNEKVVKEIPTGSHFMIKGSDKIYVLGKKLRTRFKCQLKNSYKTYSISGNAPVIECN